MLRLARFFPLAIIQIFTGIALGPSMLGVIAPAAESTLFGTIIHLQDVTPDNVAAFRFSTELRAGIDALANVAAVLFVFLAGCEVDRQVIRNAGGSVLRIGLTGVFVPWILGGLAAWVMINWAAYGSMPAVIGTKGAFLYSVSFGLCMAVTALPVLVIVLREVGFNQKPIGSLAIAIGGIDDLILWLSMAVLLPFAAAAGNFGTAFVLAATGGLATYLAVRHAISPLLERLIRKDAPERLLVSMVIVTLFFSAAITELTGLHAVLGAFITGLFLPDKLRHMVGSKFDVPVTLLLLPFFFLSTGLRTSFDFVNPTVWIIAAVALVVCVGGKFLGISIPSYLSGQSAPFSITLGVLMQCKGLMEIVVVTVLYHHKVIGEATFSALVLTALVSTAMTAGLVRVCQRLFGDSASATREAEPVEVSVAPAASLPAALRQASPARLVFGDGIGEITVAKPELLIGRHSENDIRVNDVRVSRQHARLAATGDGRIEIRNETAGRSEPIRFLSMGLNGNERFSKMATWLR